MAAKKIDNSFTIYHNPRCTKSREALEILRAKGVEIKIVRYLVTPLTYQDLKNLLVKLNMRPMYILRKEEDLYKKKFKGKYFTDDEWTKIMVENPILIERPIVTHHNKGLLCRPPRRVLELFPAKEE